MKEAFLTGLARLGTPLGVLIAAVLLAVALPGLSPSVQTLFRAAPYLIVAAAMVMAWRLKRTGSVFVLGLVALAWWTVSVWMPGGMDRDVISQVAYPALCIAAPLNILLFAAVGDRGFITPWGLLVIVLISIQSLHVLFVTSAAFGLMDPLGGLSFQGEVAQWLHGRVFSPAFDAWTNLPQFAIFSFALTLLALLAMALHSRGPIPAGFFGATAALALGLDSVGHPQTAVYFTASAVCMLAALFQDSYRMAYLDELTEIPTRRALNADVRKLGGSYAVAMVDVDHFKKFNDTWGHDVGDQVLRMVASHLRRVGGGGRGYRYGGEEFTVLFPKLGVKEALPHLENLREAIATADFVIRAKNRPKKRPEKPGPRSDTMVVHVTVSIGAAERGARFETFPAALKAADQALYKAKGSGRNRVARK